ncbi:LysM peptidoglycan-binding domain-containing protein, partial [Cellulomonas algicola]|uniref:LysM peptidoglycan-binding domain-containing protein n=1 Tax=Cellulomonas algicola TaxID=2071633 RepID=UPI000F56C31A
AAVLGLAVAAGAAALTAVLLGVRTAELAGTGAWRVESAVELGVTAVGALVAAWLAASAGVALVCSVARAVGASWRTGEHLVQRCAPVVVRRVLVLAIGAGVGLAGATGASAATPVAPDAPPAVSSMSSDLGWAPTSPGDARSGPHSATHGGTATAAPSAGAPDTPHERAVDADAAGRTASTSQGSSAASAAHDAPSPGEPSPGESSPGESSPDAPSPDAPASTSGAATAPAPSSAATALANASRDPHVSTGSARPTGPTAPSAGPAAADAPTGGSRTASWSSAPAGGLESGSGATPRSSATPAGTTVDAGSVVVQPGDTLWSIAARHLPAGADDAAVAAAWPRWYAANVDVVGADPDLLLPGQVLAVPTTDGTVAP